MNISAALRINSNRGRGIILSAGSAPRSEGVSRSGSGRHPLHESRIHNPPPAPDANAVQTRMRPIRRAGPRIHLADAPAARHPIFRHAVAIVLKVDDVPFKTGVLQR